ncbi:acyltransferase family protein [Azospirillum picis]|uniref:Peptidoglycan/LPS O-acetylase OafA/YrhL n=1 Tax=Azospirillum picis TaxID=488438 RepID=A0ABU0MLN0_9PROT|nr:acyltransferase [Azospirillum picis]MBP2301005.1 peptidoglycan/LPS O-acetylase OafA/YrhL [Azospirillum picis]MDQ0534375.1 peptidoglycan/LPS O-acetylase OafA/YrhL [Azospirillum picis]
MPTGLNRNAANHARTANAPSPPGHLHSLTPLRGIAALWVVLYHYAFQYFPNIHPERYTHLLQKGYLAVDLFFMLSGFVLTHVYHDAFSRPAQGTRFRGTYWNFLKARIARLYPLHLAVLLLFVATALAFRTVEYAATGTFQPIPLQGAESVGALVANLLMVQGLYASMLSWNYPAWSISLEFMAYLVFPIALPLVWRASGRVQATLALAAFAALGGLAWLTQDNLNQWDGPQTLLRCLPEFLLGTLLYSAYRCGLATSLLSRDATAAGLALAILLLLHLNGPDLLAVPLFALLILAAVANRGRTARMLNIRPLVWLGDVSYSLYLLHGFVEYATTRLLMLGPGIHDRKALPGGWSVALLLAMVAVCLLVAGPAYRRIELAGRRYLRDGLSFARLSPGGARMQSAVQRAAQTPNG